MSTGIESFYQNEDFSDYFESFKKIAPNAAVFRILQINMLPPIPKTPKEALSTRETNLQVYQKT